MYNHNGIFILLILIFLIMFLALAVIAYLYGGDYTSSDWGNSLKQIEEEEEISHMVKDK